MAARVYQPSTAEQAGDRSPDAPQPPTGELVKSLVHDLMLLTSQQLRLARRELQEKVTRGQQIGLRLLSGGLLVFAGFITLLVGIALGYGIFLPFWLASLLVGLLILIIGVMLLRVGRRQLGSIGVMPRQTLAALRADRRLLKAKLLGMPGGGQLARARPARQPQRTGKGQTMWHTLQETIREWRADNASQLAAALAYYTVISIAPLLVLVVVIVGFLLGREAAETQLLAQLRTTLGVQGSEFLQLAIENASQPSLASWAGILSSLTLLWGSTNVFSQLQSSLNQIWGVEPRPDLGIWVTIRTRALAFALVLGAALLVLASVIASSVLSTLVRLAPTWLPGGNWLWQGINYLVALLIITLLVAVIYKVLPDVKLPWRQLWPGAVVTGLLFTLGQAILAWYLSNTGSTYGAVGSVVVFLLWVYYSAQILFLGAEFTQVYARQRGAEIQPAANAVRTAPAN